MEFRCWEEGTWGIECTCASVRDVRVEVVMMWGKAWLVMGWMKVGEANKAGKPVLRVYKFT